MDGGALFDPGFLGGQFLWWVGQIPDDATWRDNILPGKFADRDTGAGWGRRYKVRIIGIHDKGEEVDKNDGQINDYHTRHQDQHLEVYCDDHPDAFECRVYDE